MAAPWSLSKTPATAQTLHINSLSVSPALLFYHNPAMSANSKRRIDCCPKILSEGMFLEFPRELEYLERRR